jgi:hypothetical protein
MPKFECNIGPMHSMSCPSNGAAYPGFAWEQIFLATPVSCKCQTSGHFSPQYARYICFVNQVFCLPIYTAKACQDGRIVPVISSGANRSANREGWCLGVARRRAVPNTDLIVAVTDNSSREEVSNEGSMFQDRTETAMNGRQ